MERRASGFFHVVIPLSAIHAFEVAQLVHQATGEWGMGDCTWEDFYGQGLKVALIPHDPLIPLARTQSCGHTELQRQLGNRACYPGEKNKLGEHLPTAQAYPLLILALCCIYSPVQKAIQ